MTMAPEEMTASEEIVKRQITDAIGALQASRTASGTCPIHPGQVDATILNLSICEQVLHRTGLIMQRLDSIAEIPVATMSIGKAVTLVGGPCAVALAIIATIWKAKGWM